MSAVHAAEALRRRTKALALDIVRTVRLLPRTRECDVIARQVIRSSMSVAANYRAVCRCRSRAEFVSKMNVTLEEADETLFWLEAIEELEIAKTRILQAECGGLVRIFAASLRTARRRTASMEPSASVPP
ncbi:MAG: four helix bundle protein [Syntrophomonadaceae bacterium]